MTTATIEKPGNVTGTELAAAPARPAVNLRAPAGNVATLKNLLERSKQQMADLLPAHLTPERLIRIALLSVTKTPRLLECSLESILQSVMQAAGLGLDPGGVLGEAYLIPYKGQCQLQPGYRGLAKLARQSGGVRDVRAEVVYRQDEFSLVKGSDPKVVHVPDLDGECRDDDIVGAYMIADLVGGGQHIEWMNVGQIERARACGYKTRDADSPWVKWYSEQCRKTVLKRGTKLLPLSTDRWERALDLDAALAGQERSTVVSDVPAPARGTAGLIEKMTARPVSEGQTFEADEGEAARRELAERFDDDGDQRTSAAAPPQPPAVAGVTGGGHSNQPDGPSGGNANPAGSPLAAGGAGHNTGPASAPAAEDRALAEEAAERELADALAGPWPDVLRVLLDAAEARGVARGDAAKAVAAHVLRIGKKGKEDTISRDGRRELHAAIIEGRLTLGGQIEQEV